MLEKYFDLVLWLLSGNIEAPPIELGLSG